MEGAPVEIAVSVDGSRFKLNLQELLKQHNVRAGDKRDGVQPAIVSIFE